jgi:hypothetical protein
MTLEQIREQAIERAAKAAVKVWVDDYGYATPVSEPHFIRRFDQLTPSAQEALLVMFRDITRVAIDAYEKAMDRSFDDAPRDGSAVLARHYHFGWIEVRYADRGVWITRDGREITRVEHLMRIRPSFSLQR